MAGTQNLDATNATSVQSGNVPGRVGGRVLSTEDIEHYRKVVKALHETSQIMQEIDEVIEKHGGWPLAGSILAEVK